LRFQFAHAHPSTLHTTLFLLKTCSENNKTSSKHTDDILRSIRHKHALTQQQQQILCYNKCYNKKQETKIIMLCYVMLCYVMLCYVMLCYDQKKLKK